MTSTTSVLSIDFETCSTADLRKTGAAAYAADPSTRIICMAWAFDDEPVNLWRPGQPFPERVLHHVSMGGLLRGWNVAFEDAIWDEVLGRHMVPRVPLHIGQLRDTMAAAAYWGLPMALDKAGLALGLGVLKDKAGHALMLRMCRPRAFAADGSPRWWHEEDAQKAAELGLYCMRDVDAERAIAKNLPPLPDKEQAVWELDFRINQRGVNVDKTLIDRMETIAAEARKNLNKRLAALTGGQVATATNTGKLLPWLQAAGVPVPDVRRGTLLSALPAASGAAAEAIRIRLDAARTSTKKLAGMLAARHPTTLRLHGLLQYYGAGRTGRWAGRLVQPQNFPRGTIKGVDRAVQAILAGAGPDDLELLFEDSALGAIASCLRGCLVASPGNAIVSADLAQIEARMVAWLAGQQDILEVFKRGEDVYVYTAGKVGSSDRQLGKVLVLACGFGMGWPKFQATALTYGLSLDDEFAEDSVGAWRQSNPAIVNFWWDCDRAAKAVAKGSPLERVRDVTFRRRGGSMLVELPSGRQLVYRGISLQPDPSTGRDSIVYYGVHQTTRQWQEIRTYGGKIVENLTQAAARDVMADALIEIDRAGLHPVLSIHDEAIGDEPASQADAALDTMLKIMRTTPSWAPGLPVGAEGWTGERYRKG